MPNFKLLRQKWETLKEKELVCFLQQIPTPKINFFHILFVIEILVNLLDRKSPAIKKKPPPIKLRTTCEPYLFKIKIKLIY